MERPIPESDWKRLKKLHPLALERFCLRVLDAIQQVQDASDQSAHQRYLDIYRLVQQQDRKLRQLFDRLTRSNAILLLVGLRQHGLLTDEELAGFSQDTRSTVGAWLK